jgi:hypothetical protein
MGQLSPGNARETEAIGHAIRHSQSSLKTLAQRDGINSKTVAK